jgi:hypothetical protein
MKKTSPRNAHKQAGNGDLQPEYVFDYKKAKPNRFAGRGAADALVITLDSDIAAVFTSAQAVNKALRALISAVPMATKKKVISSRRA